METKDELKECPFCGGVKFTRNTDSGDERIGYNITHTITCSGCGCSKSARSKQDKNGWCVEGSDDVRKRAMNAWNTRATSVEILKSENESLIKLIGIINRECDIDEFDSDLSAEVVNLLKAKGALN